MSWFENILIIAGISLDIFAAMEIEGAMLAEVKRKSLIIACTLITLLQMVTFYIGYFVCMIVSNYGYLDDAQWLGYVIAVVIFGLLGIRLIVKAIRREFVQEKRRENIEVKQYIRIIAVTSFYTLCAGCACGLIGTNAILMAVVILICSILVVIGGLYTGYHFGFESKTIAYVAGALMLWIAGVEILLHSVLQLF